MKHLTYEEILSFGPGEENAKWKYEDQIYFAMAVQRATLENVDEIISGQSWGEDSAGIVDLITAHIRTALEMYKRQEKFESKQPAKNYLIDDDAARANAVMEHLGPAALAGGRMSVYDAFNLGWKAKAEMGTKNDRDAERLDWLDKTNAPYKMGWRVGVAPAGNASVNSVIQLGGKVTSIRDAIDAAILQSEGTS